MGFTNFFKKKKKKFKTAMSGLGSVAKTYSNTLNKTAQSSRRSAQNYVRPTSTKFKSYTHNLVPKAEHKVQMFSTSVKKTKPVKATKAYLKPTKKVRVRDFSREVPVTMGKAANLLAPAKSFVKTTGDIFGTAIARKNPGKVFGDYKKSDVSLDNLPTQAKLAGGTGMAMLDAVTMGKGPAIATGAKVIPRVAYGAATGYAYDIMGKTTDKGKVEKSNLKPGLGTVIGSGAGYVSKPALKGIAKEVRGIQKDVKQIKNPNIIKTPKNRYENAGTSAIVNGKPQIRLKENAFVPRSKSFQLLDNAGMPEGMSIKDVTKHKEFAAKLEAKKQVANKTVTKQLQNQRQGLQKTEKGFVSPKELKAPQSSKIIPKTLNFDDILDSKEGSQVFTELQTSEAGKRLYRENTEGIGNIMEVTGIKSSFPKFVPSHLKERKLFDKVQEHILEKTVPKTKRVRELYDVVIDEIASRKGVDKSVAKNVVQKYKNPSKKMPSIEEYVDGKSKSVSKVIEKKVKNETGEYNTYQQKAFDKKQERIEGIQNIIKNPNELLKVGYKKHELNRMGAEEVKFKLKLSKLGYPKKQMDNMDIKLMKKIGALQVPRKTLDDYYKKVQALKTNFLEGIDVSKIKDITGFKGNWRDMYRNFEHAFGDEFPKIKERLLDVFDDAKATHVNEQRALIKDLHENIVVRLGIKKRSKESAYVQKWGENQYISKLQEEDIPEEIKRSLGLDEIKNLSVNTNVDWREEVIEMLEEVPEFKKQVVLNQLKKASPKKWLDVIEADKWFRQTYDRLIDEINVVREANFPTHPLYPESTKQIPKRNDYYRHFREMDGLEGFKNMFETSGAIEPKLAAISDTTNPKTKWLSHAQKRLGLKTEYDAVGGFLDYSRAHAYAKNIDPFIQKFKGIDEETLKKMSTKEKQYMPDFRGLSEELSDAIDPVYQISVSKDIPKIKDVLIEHGVSERQSEWMSKELAEMGDYDGVLKFIKDKTKKNKEDVIKNMAPKTMAEDMDNKMNNFLGFITDFSRDLAGKTNSFDRPLQKSMPFMKDGRKMYRIINKYNSKFKANAVLGNASSSLAQFFNMPQGFASAGTRHSAKAVGKTLARVLKRNLNEPIEKSSFIKERYFNDYNKFDVGFLDNATSTAAWIMGFGDEVGARFIWNAHYEKALKEGAKNPVRYADEWTRKMIAGRGVGEVPLAQKAKITQLIMPFQLEVANQWYALRDIAGNDPRKLVMAKKMIEFSVASFVMNHVVKEIRGSDVSFDPINAMIEGHESYKEDDNKLRGAAKAAGRVGGEVLSNLPLGQQVAAIYPKYGWGINEDGLMPESMAKILNTPRKEFFGEGDPTRFGTGGLPALSAFKRPHTRILPPFGGKQIEKTVAGYKTMKKGYAENAAGNIMTPVKKTPTNWAKGLLFGPGAINEVQDYYDEKSKPLGKMQTEKYKLMGNNDEYFDKISADRASNREKEQMKKGDNPIENQNLLSGMRQLSNGKVYVPTLDREFATTADAGLAMKIESMETSSENFMDLGDIVLRKSNDGTVHKMRKTSFTASVLQERLESQKRNKNIESWLQTADQKFELMHEMMQDPSFDDLDKARIQNDIDSLMKTYQKYQGYGGFAKPKKGKKLAEKYRYPLIDSDFVRINALISGTKAKKYRGTHKPLRLIARKPPKVSRTRKKS